MNIKDIYYKIKKECELSIASLGYTYKDEYEVIQVGATLNVNFMHDELNIQSMTEISQRPGFMFFNNSLEGVEFWKKNKNKVCQH